MKKILFNTVLLFTTALLITCTKTTTGPQGEKGDKGDPGATGATGASGAKFTINYVTVKDSDWVVDNANQAYAINLTQNGITNNVLSSGNVWVYIDIGGGAWQALPYKYNGNFMIQFAYGYQVLKLNCTAEGVLPDRPKTHYYKIVISG